MLPKERDQLPSWPIAVATWVLFVVGFLLLCLLHYNSALLQSSDVLWFTTHIILTVIAIPVVWRGTAGIESIALRWFAFVAQQVAGFMLYCVLCLLYIVEWAGFTL